MFVIESAVLAFTVLFAWGIPRQAIERPLLQTTLRFRQFAQNRVRSVVIVGVSSVLLRVALLPVAPIPQPGVTDEFSHLLMADTFAHGRLTNPIHPMWKHFESFAIIQKPSYCSAFYPAPSLFLAFGELLGNPFWGLCLSVALMCAAICWALQAWLPAEWALLGGLLALIRLGTFSYWANGYAGGAVPALGGALMLGALPRIKEHQRVLDALLLGLGTVLLANSRPYEGLFFSAPIFVSLIYWVCSRGSDLRKRALMRAALPTVLVLLSGAGFMGHYFKQTSGSPFNTPYLVNMKTYFVAPNFPWSPLNSSLHYNHPVMEKFYRTWPLDAYESARSHPILMAFTKIIGLGFFFLGPLLALPLFMLAFVLPSGVSYRDIDPDVKFLLLICGSTLLGLLLPIYFNPHYAAPMTCAIYALVLIAMRRVSRWQWRGRPLGAALMGAVPILGIVLLVIRAAAVPLHVPPEIALPASWWRIGFQNIARARVLRQLQSEPGKQLVLVRYSASHYVNVEWVYNEADIDNAKVIWARDMGPENSELLHSFDGRKAWLLQPDYDPPRLTSYAP